MVQHLDPSAKDLTCEDWEKEARYLGPIVTCFECPNRRNRACQLVKEPKPNTPSFLTPGKELPDNPFDVIPSWCPLERVHKEAV